MDLAVVVPVRSFDAGKSRLSDVFTPAQRELLARTMAEIVVAPRSGAQWFVVCDDQRIADWAATRGATPVLVAARGLNASLAEAVPTIVSDSSPRGPFSHLAVSHADLPFAHDLVDIVTASIIEAPDSIHLASDRRDDGTNVAVIPTTLLDRWTFSYGQGSFTTHRELAESIGADLRIIADDRLAIDVDTIDDLEVVRDFVRATLPDWTHPRTDAP